MAKKYPKKGPKSQYSIFQTKPFLLLVSFILIFVSASTYFAVTAGTGPLSALFAPATVNRIVEDTGSGVILYQTEAQARTGTGQIYNTQTGDVKTVTKQDIEQARERNPAVEPIVQIVNQEIARNNASNAVEDPNDPPTKMDSAKNTPSILTIPAIKPNTYCVLNGRIYLPDEQSFYSQNRCRRCIVTSQGSAAWGRVENCQVDHGSYHCEYYLDKSTGQTTSEKPRRNLLARTIYPDPDAQYCLSDGRAMQCLRGQNGYASPTMLPASDPNNRCN